MACGVPIVATSAGGTPSLVSDAGGRLVMPRDPHALAAALIDILTSPALQRSMGLHNRRRVEEEFEIERAVDRLEGAYAAVLQRTEPVRHGLSERAGHDVTP
jgi:glycosyltransferase involved in cell wall biosynthesis